MYPEIMTLEEVAEYLRTSDRTVANWAAEGRLPAGKLGTAWRFRRDDVRRWVDGQLRGVAADPADTSMGRIINRERTFVTELDNKSAVLNLLVDSLAATPFVRSREVLAAALFRREELMSTGIGCGLAVPHVRIAEVSDLTLAVALTTKPIEDYESIDGRPVRLVVMIVAREDQHPEHLRALSRFGRLVKEPDFHQSLLNSESAEALYQRLVGA